MDLFNLWGSDEEQPAPNETVIQKSFPTPNNDHVTFLRSNPNTADFFDKKFGAGSAAKLLAQEPATPAGERPEAGPWQPKVTTKDIVGTVGRGEPSTELDGLAEDLTARDRAVKDKAGAESLKRFRAENSPEAAKGWINQTVDEAQKGVDYWQERAKRDPNDQRRLEIARERLREAKEIQADAYAEEREMDPEVRLGMSMAIMRQRQIIADDMDRLDKFRSDPETRDDLLGRGAYRKPNGETMSPGDVEKLLAADLVESRKKLGQLEAALKAGKQRGQMRGATAGGEFTREFARGLATVTGMVGADLDSWAEKIAGERLGIAPGVFLREFADRISADIPRAAQGEILKLDTASPTFARDVKLYVAGKVGQALGTSLPIMATAIVNAPAGLALGLSMGRGEMRNTLEEAFAQEGVELDAATLQKTVDVYGTAMGALDTILPMLITSGAKSFGFAAKREIAQNLAIKIAKGMAKGAAVEGATEAAQELIQEIGRTEALKQGIDWDKFAPQMIEAFAAGSVGGAVLGGVGLSGENSAIVRDRRQAEINKAIEAAKKEIEAKSLLQDKAVPEGKSPAPPVPGVPTAEQPTAPAEPAAPTQRPTIEAQPRDPSTVPQEPTAEPQPIPVQRPTDVLRFIRERGGIVDETGDLKAMDAPRGIIAREGEGMRADDIRQSLIDAGYLSPDPVDREATSTIDDVYELVRRGLAGETVVPIGRENDLSASEQRRNAATMDEQERAQILGDLEGELRDYGIPYDLEPTEEARVIELVREQGVAPSDAFERVAMQRIMSRPAGATGGGRGARATQAQAAAPFPLTERLKAVQGYTPSRADVDGLRRYLKNGGSLSRRGYHQIASAVGVQESNVPALLKVAEQAGVLNRDSRGRYRRGQLEDPNSVEVDPMAAVNAADMQGMVRRQLLDGKTVTTGQRTIDRLRSALEPMFDMIPQDAHLAVVSAIRPRPLVKKHGLVDLEMLDLRTGQSFTVDLALPIDTILRVRAFHVAGTSVALDKGAIVFAPVSLSGVSDHALAGQAYHEAVHLRKRRGDFSVADWSRLVRHVSGLRVMDMQLGTFLGAVKDPTASNARPDETLVSEYARMYRGRDNLPDLLDEEGVAHFVELYHHGYWSEAEIAPVRDIIDRVIGPAVAGSSVGSDPMFAIAGMPEPSLNDYVLKGPSPAPPLPKETDALGFYSAALEAAKGIKQAKGTPEQMISQVAKAAGVKANEIEALGLKDAFQGKKSITREELIGYIRENRVVANEASHVSKHNLVYNSLKDDAYAEIEKSRQFVNVFGSRPNLRLNVFDSADSMKKWGLSDKAISAVQAARNFKLPSAKWSNFFLDPSNPTYRETVVHLPDNSRKITGLTGRAYEDALAKKHFGKRWDDLTERERNIAHNKEAENFETKNFLSGHWSEPNVIGHARTSMHDGPQGKTFLVGELQSDWGQKLREDPENVARALARLDGHQQELAKINAALDQIEKTPSNAVGIAKQLFDDLGEFAPDYADGDGFIFHLKERKFLLEAEIRDFGNYDFNKPMRGHPLVNTTDQWVDTMLRRMIRQAIDDGADAIAIPSGKTVDSYGMGAPLDGLTYAYDKMYPKNLRNILRKLDKDAPDGVKVDTLKSSDGRDVGHGFTVFPLTDKLKGQARGGLPMFAIGGRLAAGADLSAMKKAEQMLARRVPSETVRKETGWYRDPNGHMKFEIDDSASRWNADAQKRTYYAQDGGRPYQAELDGKVGQVFEHDLLYRHYPSLKDLPVRIGFGDYYGTGGSISDGMISVNVQEIDDWAQARKILLHELQHYIQEMEGFQGGWNPDFAVKRNEGILLDLERAIADAEKSGDTPGIGHNRLAALKEARDAIQTSQKYLVSSWFGPSDSALDAYNRTYGEVEARNVMARADLTPEQRRMTPIERTQDVKNRDVIDGEDGFEVSIPDEGKIAAEVNRILESRPPLSQNNTLSAHVVLSDLTVRGANEMIRVWDANIADYASQLARAMKGKASERNYLEGTRINLQNAETIRMVYARMAELGYGEKVVAEVKPRGVSDLIGERTRVPHGTAMKLPPAPPLPEDAGKLRLAEQASRRLHDQAADAYREISRKAGVREDEGLVRAVAGNLVRHLRSGESYDQVLAARESVMADAYRALQAVASKDDLMVMREADYIKTTRPKLRPASELNIGGGLPMFALSSLASRNNAKLIDDIPSEAPHPKEPILAFHGTQASFERFDLSKSQDIGNHFGTVDQANDRLVTLSIDAEKRVIPVVIDVKNPMQMNDLGMWEPIGILKSMERQGVKLTDEERTLFDAAQTKTEQYDLLRSALEREGYDGIRYRNEHEGAIDSGDRQLQIAELQGMQQELAAEQAQALEAKDLKRWKELSDQQRALRQDLFELMHGKTSERQWSYIVWTPGKVRSALVDNKVMFALAGRGLTNSQQRTAKPGTEAPSKALDELIGDLADTLDVTLRHGRLDPVLSRQASASGSKLRGQHNSATGVSRTRVALDMDAFSHEAGHALMARPVNDFGINLRNLATLHQTELGPLDYTGQGGIDEGFAEFFRIYITNPSVAENKAPNFYDEFEDLMDRIEPDMRTNLEEIQKGFQEWIDAPSGGVVKSTVKSAVRPGFVQQIRKAVETKGFKQPIKDWMDGVYTATVDNLHPVRMAVNELLNLADQNLSVPLAKGQSLGIAAARDPYKLLRLARNAYQAGHMDLTRGVRDYLTTQFQGPSFTEAVNRAVGGDWSTTMLDNFGAYLVSRRMVREWDRFAAGEITNFPDKLSKGDHEQSIADFEKEFPEFKNAALLLYDYQTRLLRKMMDAGFITPQAFATYTARPDYVPLHRVMDEGGVSGSMTRNGKISPIKRFRGSTRDIINPLESIVKASYEINYVIARNDAVKALDRLARAVGPGGGAIAERIPAHQMKGTNMDALEVAKTAAKQAGIDPADIAMMVSDMEAVLGDETEATIFRAGDIVEGKEPILWLWEDGKRVAIRLADGDFGKELFEAFTGLSQEFRNPFLEMLTYPTRMLRRGVTVDPAFMAANYFRDQASGWMLTEDLMPVTDAASGTVAAARSLAGIPQNDLDLYNALGGIMGGEAIEGMSEARVKRDVKALGAKGINLRVLNPFTSIDALEKATGLTETGTRLALFRNAMKRGLRDGLSEYEAAIEAAWSSVDYIDFTRHGSRMLVAKRLLLFMNAAIQGLDRARRVAIGQENSQRAMFDAVSPYLKQRSGQPLTVMERKRVPLAAKMWAKMAAYSALTTALFLLYEDDDEFQEIPEYFRTTHIIFKGPDGDWWRIPRPFELGAMGLAMERSFEAYYRGDEKAMERLRTGLYGLFVPPHGAPGVQLAYELATGTKMDMGESVVSAGLKSIAGKDTGQAIVPEYLKKLPPEMQFMVQTTEFSKWMAQQTGLSAAKIDHVLSSVGGPLAMTAARAPEQMFGEKETRREDALFVKRFAVDPARSSQSKREFWSLMGYTNADFTQAANGYKERLDRGQTLEAQEFIKRLTPNERAYAVLENVGTADERRQHPMNRAKDIISVTNGLRRELATGELKRADGQPYSPNERTMIDQAIEQLQMREARNALVVIGHPGFGQLRVMPSAPVLEEIAKSLPDFNEEMETRLAKKKIVPFEDVQAGWPDLKASLLDGSFEGDREVTRKRGRQAN